MRSDARSVLFPRYTYRPGQGGNSTPAFSGRRSLAAVVTGLGSGPRVEAVIVNHNTSLFAELALRSLHASIEAGPELPGLRLTVLDNHSTDSQEGLLDAVKAAGANFELSRWPAKEAQLNTHGDVLRDFVLGHPDPDYYLFIDSDIDFETQVAAQTMVDELEADPGLWAVQARFSSTEAREPGASLDIWAGRDYRVVLGEFDFGEGWRDDSRTAVTGTIHRRCHPGATLVRNSDLFQGLAAGIGFSSAVMIAADPAIGGFYDTFGLVSAGMGAAGYHYGLSSVRVHHFFMASYDQVHVVAREADCRRRLSRFS